MDMESRIKYNPIPRTVISEKLRMDSVAEEMRILYVAMTRAKEKLIITGVSSAEISKAEEWTMYNDRKDVKLPVFDIASKNSYMDWIMTAVSRHRAGQAVCDINY